MFKYYHYKKNNMFFNYDKLINIKVLRPKTAIIIVSKQIITRDLLQTRKYLLLINDHH